MVRSLAKRSAPQIISLYWNWKLAWVEEVVELKSQGTLRLNAWRD